MIFAAAPAQAADRLCDSYSTQFAALGQGALVYVPASWVRGGELRRPADQAAAPVSDDSHDGGRGALWKVFVEG